MRKFSPRTRVGYPSSTTASIKNWLPGGIQLVYSAEVLADSPYLYWRLGDTSGTTATDSSGNGRNGTYTNTPTLDQSPLITVNRSVDFNGTDEYVTYTIPSAITGNFTAEAWVNFDSFTSYPGILGAWAASTSGNYGFNLAPNTGGTIDINLSNSTFTNWALSVSTGVTLSTGTTYHVVCTCDDTNNTVILYINGVAQYTNTSVTTAMGLANGSRAFRAAMPGSIAAGYADARIDEVAIYTTALSATRVSAHYLAGTQGVEL